MRDLGTLGGDTGVAYAINDNGEIVGLSTTTSNLESRPFLYSDGRMYDLGTLGGTNINHGGIATITSFATDINNLGQVVGQAAVPDGSQHAFLYHNGMMTDLNDLVTLTSTNGPAGFLALSVANGINHREQIVGTGTYWDGANVTTRAFLLNLKP